MIRSYARSSVGLLLFDLGAFLDKTKSPDGKGFKLKLHEKNPNAPLSPFYLNFRTPDNPKPGPLTPVIIKGIGRELYEESIVDRIEYDCLAGVPRAGDPLTRAFSEFFFSKRNYAIPVLKLEKHESERKRRIAGLIEGEYKHGELVLLIDDLITNAGSKLEAIDVLENAGLIVSDVLVLIDCMQGGRQQLQEKGYQLHTIFTIYELLDLYLEANKIDHDLHQEIFDYLALNK